MSTTRIYAVTVDKKTRLVRAPNKAQAINHVARDTISAEVASQDTLIAEVAAGATVEASGDAE